MSKDLLPLLARDLISTVNTAEKKLAGLPADDENRAGFALELAIYQAITSVVVHANELQNKLAVRDKMNPKLYLPK